MKWFPNKWDVTRGDDAQLVVHLLDSEGNPINAHATTGVSLLLKNEDGSVITKAATSGIASSLASEISIFLFDFTGAETALLPVVSGESVELQIHFGSRYQKFELVNALTTFDPKI